MPKKRLLTFVIAASSLFLAAALSGCGSDSDTSTAVEPSPSSASTVDADRKNSYDLTFTGVLAATATGSEMDCVVGEQWLISTGSDEALGATTLFNVSEAGSSSASTSAKNLRATLRIGEKSQTFVSFPGNGMSLSADGATVTLTKVPLEGSAGQVTVSGTMTCGE